MKRKFLAALLALVMVFSMIPVSASADGTIYEGNDTFYYHITDSSLANMVAEKRPEGSSSDVSRVTITFNHDYSAGGQNTFVFRNGYTIALSNVSDYVQPDDIAYLTISFVDDTSVVIPQVETLPRRYDLRLATDDNTCTVTFYYQPGDYVDNGHWKELSQVSVEKGTSLGDRMPALPNEGTAHWVAWETGSNNGDGAEFTADTVVDSDLSVYARKVTNGSGRYYDVMNQDNRLFETILELYLDEHPNSDITTENVQISKISVNGSEKSTNPDYSPLGTSYGWQDNYSRYWIYNLENHTGEEGGTYYNDRVPPDDIRNITIYATVNSGAEEAYVISRSELDVRVESNSTIEIYIRDTSEEEVTPPTAPNEETVIELAGENAVAVECTTNEEHEQVTSSLKEGSITVGNVVSIGEGEYTCTVTVKPGSYVTAYNTTYSGSNHSLNPTEQNGEILLVFNGDGWTIAGDTPYVTFTVACATEPEEETPPAPDLTAFNISVTVACTNNPSDHAVKYYELLKDSYTLGTVTQNGTTYEYTITVQSEKYVEKYNTEYGPHELDKLSSSEITVRFIYSDEKWEIAEDSRSPVFFVTCAEGGEEQPETPPTIDEDGVIKLMGDNAIEVACKTEGSGHNPSSYRLIPGSFDVGKVTKGEDGKYSCVITSV